MSEQRPTMNERQREELGRRIAARIAQQFGNRVQQLEVEVQSDGLVVRGQVQSYHVKQLVQNLVMQESTLPMKVVEIRVRRLSGGVEAVQ